MTENTDVPTMRASPIDHAFLRHIMAEAKCANTLSASAIFSVINKPVLASGCSSKAR